MSWFVDKYSRSQFYPKTTVDGTRELILRDKFNTYTWKKSFKKYKVTDIDLRRPDLISFKNYGRVNYFWIIMRLNNIHDIWNDLSIGMILNIPYESDIQDLITYMRQ